MRFDGKYYGPRNSYSRFYASSKRFPDINIWHFSYLKFKMVMVTDKNETWTIRLQINTTILGQGRIVQHLQCVWKVYCTISHCFQYTNHSNCWHWKLKSRSGRRNAGLTPIDCKFSNLYRRFFSELLRLHMKMTEWTCTRKCTQLQQLHGGGCTNLGKSVGRQSLSALFFIDKH